ncbi:MAG: hypothetical protein KY462_10040 [Actinobacteria bacterium]|nr:hypothetical protein [Actinomycetota bacterium]
MRGTRMCYTCGCGEPTSDHGDERNITERDFERAADAMDISPEQARRNALGLLREVESQGA